MSENNWRPPSLEGLERTLLLLGLIATVAFSVASAVWAFPATWLMPFIFITLFMILRTALQSNRTLEDLQRPSTPVSYFSDNREFYGDLAKHVASTAKYKLAVSYFRGSPPTNFTQDEAKDYFAEVLSWAKDNPSRAVRRIICVDTDEMRTWIDQHLDETAGIANYEARIISGLGNIDLLNVAILDNHLVYLAFSGPTGQHMSGMSMEGPRACEYFKEYYDKVWSNAKPMKDWIEEHPVTR